jgi:hypothetical protein
MNRGNVRKLLIGVAVSAALFLMWRPVLRACIDLLIDSEAQPQCHKQVDGDFHRWQTEHKTRDFPNTRGESWASMQDLPNIEYFPELKSHYSYVPGLTRDDPGDLVLMYVNQPTRWTWHGSPPTVFTKKAWILVPVDMKCYGSRESLGPGEFSERVTYDEFRQRLEKTLDFLKEKKRPHWEAVVKEHSEFLNRLKLDVEQ